MTQEEKDLLFKDITARLPYQPMCEFTDTEDDFCKTTGKLGYSLRDFVAGKVIIKPYLRPMSSITEEELKELVNLNLIRINSYKRDFVIKETEFFLDICWYVQIAYKDNNGDECVTNLYVGRGSSIEEIDWLNKKHFDYRGLIPKGLALEAPEGMYK